MSGNTVCNWAILEFESRTDLIPAENQHRRSWTIPGINAEKSLKNPGKLFSFFVGHPVKELIFFPLMIHCERMFTFLIPILKAKESHYIRKKKIMVTTFVFFIAP